MQEFLETYKMFSFSTRGSSLDVVLGYARFKRRTLHVPNLINEFSTCKVRRLNRA